jgi:hypothetical protein
MQQKLVMSAFEFLNPSFGKDLIYNKNVKKFIKVLLNLETTVKTNNFKDGSVDFEDSNLNES